MVTDGYHSILVFLALTSFCNSALHFEKGQELKRHKMSFKSFIQDMRGESKSIIRKEFEVKFVSWMRSRLDREVQPGWARLLPELLRDVLMRMDTSEDTWPPGKNVVACAGVCRKWREIVKEIVKSPEFSGKLTLPFSLKQPGPRDSLLWCFIKGTRKGQKYHLYLRLNQDSTDNGKFLLAAQKCQHPTHTDYIISLNSDDVSKGSSTYVGKLRSNFPHTKFAIFDAQPPHAGVKLSDCRSTRLINRKVTPKVPPGNYSIGHISYELNVLGSRGPRRMHCVLDAIPNSAVEPGGVAPTLIGFLLDSVDSFPPFFRSKSMRTDSFQSGHSSVPSEGILVLRNKASRWHDRLRSWYLNFKGVAGPEDDNFILLKTHEQLQSRTLNLLLKGRGETIASAKNFQLVASPDNGVAGPEHENVILQFEKVGKDVFAMDYQYPISAFQAFAICLSSFDTRIGCE